MRPVKNEACGDSSELPLLYSGTPGLAGAQTPGGLLHAKELCVGQQPSWSTGVPLFLWLVMAPWDSHLSLGLSFFIQNIKGLRHDSFPLLFPLSFPPPSSFQGELSGIHHVEHSAGNAKNEI